MQGISTVDGFVETAECLAEMIKYVANEPSVGLFYVQQHAQNAIPNVVHLKNNVVEKTKETVLHTEDLEDSISMIQSMKDCGTPVADDMIQDIGKSLALMSKKQPRRGLISKSASGLQIGRSFRGWDLSGGYAEQDRERTTTNYLSTIFKTAKERATGFQWPQLNSEESVDIQDDKPLNDPIPLQSVARTASLSQPEVKTNEQPSSTATSHEPKADEQEKQVNYDRFKADKEAKLEEWLGNARDDAEDS